MALLQKTHKYSVGRTYSCWMLNWWWCITWPAGFTRSKETKHFLRCRRLFLQNIRTWPNILAAQQADGL